MQIKPKYRSMLAADVKLGMRIYVKRLGRTHVVRKIEIAGHLINLGGGVRYMQDSRVWVETAPQNDGRMTEMEYMLWAHDTWGCV